MLLSIGAKVLLAVLWSHWKTMGITAQICRQYLQEEIYRNSCLKNENRELERDIETLLSISPLHT